MAGLGIGISVAQACDLGSGAGGGAVDVIDIQTFTADGAGGIVIAVTMF
jgi:hypothetical protein